MDPRMRTFRHRPARVWREQLFKLVLSVKDRSVMLGVYIPGWASCLLRLRSGVFESPSAIYVAFSTRRLSILVGQNAFLLL
jgi:hypothetical protein